MLNENTIKQLISLPAFLSNSNKLAYELHISRIDASQELLLELLDHRLRTWTNKDVTMAITQNLPSLKWRIKYARKDIVRKQDKDATRELTKSHMVANMKPYASNQSETLEALERLPELFKNANTRTWAESVLRVGQRETMMNFNQTPRQFNSKLIKACKYARKQQPKQSNNSHAKELKLLKGWDELLNDPHTSDNDAQDFIDQHKEYISEVIVDNALIKFQGKVLKDFVNSGVDRYTFNELMQERYTKLEQELKESYK